MNPGLTSRRGLIATFLFIAACSLIGCKPPVAPATRATTPEEVPARDDSARESVPETANAHSTIQWSSKGHYKFNQWAGPQLGVYYAMPEQAGPTTPILIVVPGARRNADAYRDQWQDLANEHGFIVLAIEGTSANFPTELDYNCGGVVNAEGELQPEEKWLFSAIEPLFDNFKKQYGSTAEKYSIYGHSAGGGFVHRFVMFQPNAQFSVAVAANPAFVTMPDTEIQYPFGMKGIPDPGQTIENWFDRRLVIMLGDQDRDPRTKPLSNGTDAIQQGPCVLSRGLGFFKSAVDLSAKQKLNLRWGIEIVAGVGHSNTNIAPHAVKYLFPPEK